MIPIHHSLEVHPPHAPPPGLTAVDSGQSRDQKPKTLPCKYCSKRFRRVEHVQRHERTHTKEKPFACGWDRCGKTFGRRDLLVRHEKLVHLNDGNRDGKQPRRLSSNAATHRASFSDGHVEAESSRNNPATVRPHHSPIQFQHGQQHHQQHHQPQHQQQPAYHHTSATADGHGHVPHDAHSATPRSAACNLDVLSDAALATQVAPIQPMLNEMSNQHQVTNVPRMKAFDEPMSDYNDRPRHDQSEPMLSSSFTPQHAQPVYDDYNMFMDEFATTPHLLPPQFESDQQFSMWARSPGHLHQRGISRPSSQFGSRLASLAPDIRDPDTNSRPPEDTSRSQLLRLSVIDHTAIKSRLDEFSAVLPHDFVFPSRHTLTRFLDGYISGFHDHLPFLHLPTLSLPDVAPELLLAILAVGAQYRFESKRGYALWYAAKSVGLEQVRRRQSSELHTLLPTAASYSPHSTRPSPSISYRHSFTATQSERPLTQDTHREPYSPNTPQARLETIQAVLLLFSVGLWGAKAILQDALSLQSQLAILIRDEGLSIETSPTSLTDWEAWVRLECANRTKLIAYCFFNLCSTAYDVPPQLLTSELNLFMPLRSRLWRAESAWQWQELRQATPVAEITVHDAFSRLFGRTGQGLPTQVSSFAHYVLIHALIQHVYLLKQTSFAAGSPYDVQRTLKPEDVEEVSQALRVWQTSFEHRHQLKGAESGHVMSNDALNGGSLTFNATALLRLAYIRLYTDIPPSRSLETRDSTMIASALNATPVLQRSLRLHRAVFQAVHALSMLVKAGVNYVARAKSTEWSIQHSLCNFECALLLAKWLVTLSSLSPSDPPASPEERNLLEMVRRMLDETEFAVPIDPSLLGQSSSGQIEMVTSDGSKLRQLAGAVVRLWAETFKGVHIFEMVKVMGSSLDGYAELVDRPRERTPPINRLAPEAGM